MDIIFTGRFLKTVRFCWSILCHQIKAIKAYKYFKKKIAFHRSASFSIFHLKTIIRLNISISTLIQEHNYIDSFFVAFLIRLCKQQVTNHRCSQIKDKIQVNWGWLSIMNLFGFWNGGMDWHVSNSIHTQISHKPWKFLMCARKQHLKIHILLRRFLHDSRTFSKSSEFHNFFCPHSHRGDRIKHIPIGFSDMVSRSLAECSIKDPSKNLNCVYSYQLFCIWI